MININGMITRKNIVSNTRPTVEYHEKSWKYCILIERKGKVCILLMLEHLCVFVGVTVSNSPEKP